jgi:hypothetical protein
MGSAAARWVSRAALAGRALVGREQGVIQPPIPDDIRVEVWDER